MMATPLGHTGHRVLGRLQVEVDYADPSGLIKPAARLLCCGLAELASQAHKAVADEARDDVTLAAARLALLTKLDDEVIDSLEFHGGDRTPRDVLRRRLEAFLAPTLRSIQTCRAADPSPRCHLAARVGHDLRALAADPQRLASQLQLIAQGWQIQIDGVLTLSSRPAWVTEDQVRRHTRAISGAWLAMVTAIGWLPSSAPRWCSADEIEAFFDWGEFIQAADALADLDKEVPDKMGCSLPVYTAWRSHPDRVQRALDDADVPTIRALIADTGADRCAVPSRATRTSLERRLRHMGQVAGTLEWVRSFLLGRYLPAADRSPDTFDRSVRRHSYGEEVSCSAS